MFCLYFSIGAKLQSKRLKRYWDFKSSLNLNLLTSINNSNRKIMNKKLIMVPEKAAGKRTSKSLTVKRSHYTYFQIPVSSLKSNLKLFWPCLKRRE